MPIDVTKFLPMLRSERLAVWFVECVAELETAVASGVVLNSKLVRAKEHINRSIDNITESYNKVHGYSFPKIVSSAHDVPSGLKYARTLKDEGRIELFTSLLPIAELLKAAKPLAVKRQDAGPTDRQKAIATERAGHEMTCQCCGRGIFANTGRLAHHGYTRPGDGWQTPSCFGAKRLPWEVDRSAVKDLIDHLKEVLLRSEYSRTAVFDEIEPVVHRYQIYDRNVRGGYRSGALVLRRDTFAEAFALNPDGVFTRSGASTFDQFKTRDLEIRDRKISRLKRDIKEFTARYAGWKQTHKWNGKTWEAL